jgi:hypothetical protein
MPPFFCWKVFAFDLPIKDLFPIRVDPCSSVVSLVFPIRSHPRRSAVNVFCFFRSVLSVLISDQICLSNSGDVARSRRCRRYSVSPVAKVPLVSGSVLSVLISGQILPFRSRAMSAMTAIPTIGAHPTPIFQLLLQTKLLVQFNPRVTLACRLGAPCVTQA